ncbi:hypothetical protein DL98DRAFT_12246 [Cadophora sp. DSE1049]|nr:hypothetical protein DL98DRAFT_12246 [Cadophora sp. DSE1049]
MRPREPTLPVCLMAEPCACFPSIYTDNRRCTGRSDLYYSFRLTVLDSFPIFYFISYKRLKVGRCTSTRTRTVPAVIGA